MQQFSCSRSQVRFIGFNNMEEKEVDELFLSKGEERRKEQESRGEGGIRFLSSMFPTTCSEVICHQVHFCLDALFPYL